jgi:two-component system chemotaxis response regulator CheB
VSEHRARDIIVMGGSAGGVSAVQHVISGISWPLEAAVFVTIHLSPRVESELPTILRRKGANSACHPVNGSLIEPGAVYIAPPDHHLAITDGRVTVTHGPKENCHRPSIDVLFRSAAKWHRERVIGILLSGADDDGSAGLRDIQDCGGATVIQHPEHSEFPEMPLSALRIMDPDFLAAPAEIGPLIDRLSKEEAMPGRDVPNEHCGERPAEPEKEHGRLSALICPDCGGAIWEEEHGGVLRYRCRIGHAYSAESMVHANTESVERSLWAAVRALEESAELSRRVGRRSELLRKDMEAKAKERESHAALIRRILEEKGK